MRSIPRGSAVLNLWQDHQVSFLPTTPHYFPLWTFMSSVGMLCGPDGWAGWLNWAAGPVPTMSKGASSS